MFPTKNFTNVCEAWKLSNSKENRLVYITEETTNCIKENDVLAVEFLYKCFRDKMNGVILNEEHDMNTLLQVSAFFNALSKSDLGKFLVLIITPDESLIKWHYHLSVHADLKVKVVTANTCLPEVDDEHNLALLLQFSNIKLAENLLELDYFSVVIDDFDTVATKLIVKKLYGTFNIGLSHRNFYTTPDQKLQWNMLNWSNPGCVGKLADFYEIDNDNFANFRNNYRHWWFRLTWSFCESLKKPTETENQQYNRILKEWAQNHNLCSEKEPKESRKRKAVKNEEPEINETVKQEPKEEPIATRTRKVYSSRNIKKRPTQIVYKGETTLHKQQTNNDITEPETDITDPIKIKPKSAVPLTLSTRTTHPKVSTFEHIDTPKKTPKKQFEIWQTNTKITDAKTDFTESDSSQSSDDTIIYESERSNDNVSNEYPSGLSTSESSYVKLPSMDETPIVTSIKRTLEKSPYAITTPCKKSVFHFDNKMDGDNNILLSIIKSSPLKQSETVHGRCQIDVVANEIGEVRCQTDAVANETAEGRCQTDAVAYKTVEGRCQTDIVAMETDEPEEFFQLLVAKNEPPKSDSDDFLKNFLSKSQPIGDFSGEYLGDDVLSTKQGNVFSTRQDGVFITKQSDFFSTRESDVFSTSQIDLKEASDVEGDSDAFLNSLVGGGSKKSSKTRHKGVRDVDVERVLKHVDDVLNS